MNIVSDIKTKNQSVKTIKKIDSLTFRKDYVNKRQPVLIKNYAKEWGATKRWDLDFFLKLKDDKDVYLLSDNLFKMITATKKPLLKTI